MNKGLRNDAETIVRGAIRAVCPDAAVRRASASVTFPGKVYLVAVGKAAWRMAQAALASLDAPVAGGIVLTKYGHVEGDLPGITCLEAGHPVPDGNSYRGTRAVLELTGNLTETDTVLFLLSGGGSALFEQPLVSPEKMENVTRRMLACGADIVKINTIRKRLSGVKGGRFALWCQPAGIEAVILSDILGDPVDMIASGPVAADSTTREQALAIAEECGVDDPEILQLLQTETPKEVPNVRTQIIGSVRALCHAAGEIARELGYEPVFLTDRLCCEASQAGQELAQLLLDHRFCGKKLAFLAGGETVVRVQGDGLGGRNQELALSGAELLAGVPNAALISVGSDGTDGPTDAAGGYVDGDTLAALTAAGLDWKEVLRRNDSYHALKAVDSLIFTGPTGTNVNDIAVGLLQP